MNLKRLQNEFKRWSYTNFGEQLSKVTGAKLGSLAPLMGIAEELGELNEASSVCCEGCEDDVIDALADIFIYLVDFSNREVVCLQSLLETIDSSKPRTLSEVQAICAPDIGYSEFLTEKVGRLFHVMLKRHQGIRGFNDDAYFEKDRDEAIIGIIQALVEFAEHHAIDLQLEVLEISKKVLKRDWTVDPEGVSA